MSEPTENVDDESLVAYLDGELPKSEATRIESAARNDTVLRQRIDELRDSWALLDELPEEKVNTNLAQSTLEMVALDMGKTRSWSQWVSQFRIPLILTACVLMLGSGLAIGRANSYYKELQQLKLLPMIIVNDRLTAIPSVEFLEFLTTIDELPTTVPMTEEETPLSPRTVFTLSVDERRDWVKDLSIENRQLLSVKNRDYEDLQRSESGRADLANAEVIAQFITSIEDTEKRRPYVAAMNAYHAMIHDNTSFKIQMSDAILSGDQDAQRRLIFKELAYRYQLTDDDRYVLLDWADEWSAYEGTSSLPAAYSVMNLLSYDDYAQQITPWIISLESKLDGIASDLFLSIEPDERRDVAFAWLGAAAAGSDLSGRELRERFAQLNQRKKSELLPLPADQVRDILTSPTMQLD